MLFHVLLGVFFRITMQAFTDYYYSYNVKRSTLGCNALIPIFVHLKKISTHLTWA